MALDNEKTRFRSFAERYLIERASTFTLGKEKEDAFMVIEDAKTMYAMVETASRRLTMPPDEDRPGTQAGIIPQAPRGITAAAPTIYRNQNP